MVLVSKRLMLEYADRNPVIGKIFHFLEGDAEAQEYLRMSNVMVVKRLKYNDHGHEHARIVGGAALKLFELLGDAVMPSIVKDGVGSSEDSTITILLGAYLHDIGNSIHREMHHMLGCYLAEGIVKRALALTRSDPGWAFRIKQEVLHCIFSHEGFPADRGCLSVEAGIVRIADGLDMAEGRARLPYVLGKVDMHSLSALAIKSVDIAKGVKRPVRIEVEMENSAGVFQVERVLMEKVRGTTIPDLFETVVNVGGKPLDLLANQHRNIT